MSSPIQAQPPSLSRDRALEIFRERNQLAESSVNVDPIDIYDAVLHGRRTMTEADVQVADLRNARQVARMTKESGACSDYETAFNPFNELFHLPFNAGWVNM